MKRKDISPYEAARKAAQRQALNALRRARRAADKAGMMAQAGHGHADVRASSLAELIKGTAIPIEPLPL